MSTSYELDAMIQTVAARLDPALVCRRDVDRSLAIARFLPRWQCAGYECRLGDPAPRADFGVHLRRSHATTIDRAILAQAEPGEHSQAAWRRLDQFSRVWSERLTPISRAVPAISLEFDLHSSSARLAAPSVFFSIHPGRVGAPAGSGRAAGVCSHVVRGVLEALGVDVGRSRRTLEGCLDVVLSRVGFLQFGVWLARPVDTFRVCAPGLPLSEIQALVKALRWAGPADAYQSQWRDLLQFGDRGTVHFDVGEGVSAKLGVEITFGESSASFQRDDPEDTRLLDYLVEHDLCLPDKRDALLSWVGGFRLASRGPSDAEAAPIFLRTISHVKLVFQPGRAPEAKAYLGLGRIDGQTAH